MTTDISYAEIAHRILGKLKEINVENGESLQPFWEQFEHLKLKEGFILDAYLQGNRHAAHYELYARSLGIEDVFEDIEGKNNSYDDDEI